MIITIWPFSKSSRMSVYSVHEPPTPAPDRLDRAESLIFLRDGFSWRALFFAPLWLLVNRLWVPLLGYVAVVGGCSYGLTALGADSQWIGLLVASVHFLIAFEAATLKRWALDRRGWHMIGTVTGQGIAECERRFFDDWLPRQPLIAASSTIEPSFRRWSLFGAKT